MIAALESQLRKNESNGVIIAFCTRASKRDQDADQDAAARHHLLTARYRQSNVPAAPVPPTSNKMAARLFGNMRGWRRDCLQRWQQ